ncbi:MAG: TetR family transcriptional regulator [Actinomycetes bacterium]
MARMTPDQRREAIIAATRELIGRQGIAATTVRDVATELGTSSGLIHHYFDSMDDLLAEAFDRAATDDLRASQTVIAGGADPVQRLARFFDVFVRSADDSMQVWLDAWAEAARRPALQRTSRRVNQEWQVLLYGLIVSGCEAGVMTCPDPLASSWRILSLVDGLAVQTAAHSGIVTRNQADIWSRQSAEVEVGLPLGSLTSHA